MHAPDAILGEDLISDQPAGLIETVKIIHDADAAEGSIAVGRGGPHRVHAIQCNILAIGVWPLRRARSEEGWRNERARLHAAECGVPWGLCLRPFPSSERTVKEVRLPPNAALLLESMRSIGYDPAAAAADLIDNCIAADARNVSIRFDPGRPRALAFIDDGSGMDADGLFAAMRHGSQSPVESRAANDLGRFGLGLKTASMSQCRRLTVVTRQLGGAPHGMVWDLDRVIATQDWTVGVLEPGELGAVPFLEELLARPRGTLVVWENLDRLADCDPGDGSVLSDRMVQVGDHLARVFHRYLSGNPIRLRLDVNRQPLVAVDPFLEHEGSLAGEEERIAVGDHHVVLRAFTLPHISRLTRAQIEKAGGEAGLRREQGFYVYRNQRLIVWGTWFRMFRQEELTKSTRVRVDVPNALDHMWSLDIKKSTASPPAAVRERLRGLVPTLVRPSQVANRYRGRIAQKNGIRTIWQRVEDRDGVRYELDRDHPVIAGLRASVDDPVVSELDNVLMAIAASLPIEALYNDRANDQIGHKQERIDSEATSAELEELARQVLDAFADRRDEQLRMIDGLGSIEPFALHPGLVEKLKARLRTT